MKLFSKFVPLLIIAVSTSMVRAQSGDPLEFTAHFVRNSAGNVFIQWSSVPGYQDVLEASNDTITWTPASAPLYGFGQVFSVSVPGAQLPGTGGGVVLPVYTFSITRYPGTLMVRWTVDGLDGQPQAFRKYLYGEWASLNYLGILTYINEEAEEPYRVEVMQLGETLTSAPLPETDVPAFAQPYLNHLLNNYPGISYASVAHPYSDPQERASSPSQVRSMYRVHRFRLDSDGDGLSDYQELTSGFGDPLDADTDHDGTRDYDPATLADPMAETDGDGVRNGEDAVPYDARITWARSPECRYVMVHVPPVYGMSATSTGPLYLNNHGRIAFVMQPGDGRMLCTWQPGEASVSMTCVEWPDTAELLGLSDGGATGANAQVIYSRNHFHGPDDLYPLSPNGDYWDGYHINKIHRWALDGSDAELEPPGFDPPPGYPGAAPFLVWSHDPGDFVSVNGIGHIFTNSYDAFGEEEGQNPYYYITTGSEKRGLIAGAGNWTSWGGTQTWWGEVFDFPDYEAYNASYINFGSAGFIPDGPRNIFRSFGGVSRGGKVFGINTDFVPYNGSDGGYGENFAYWGNIDTRTPVSGVQASTVEAIASQNDWEPEAITPLEGPPGEQFRAPYHPGNLSVAASPAFVFRTAASAWKTTAVRHWSGDVSQAPVPVNLPGVWFRSTFIVNNRGEVLNPGNDPAIWRNGKLTPLSSLIEGGASVNAHSINDQGVIAATVDYGAPVLLFPVEFRLISGGPIKTIPQWLPNNGIGKGPKTGGLPYQDINVSFGATTCTLLAFGYTYTLTETAPQVWIASGGSASVQLLEPRNANASVTETIRMRIDATAPGLNASEYDMLETGPASNIFAPLPPDISLELPALSTTSADMASLYHAEHGMSQAWSLLETGAATEIFDGNGRVLQLLNSPNLNSILNIRLTDPENPLSGPVFGLRYWHEQWHSFAPTIRTNLPAASAPDDVKWHIVIRGLRTASSADIPVEFIEEHREPPEVEWTADVIGTGFLAPDGESYRTKKPVVLLSAHSLTTDIPSSDQAGSYFITAQALVPTANGKHIQHRYGLRTTGGSLLPSGTSFVLAGRRPARITRSLGFWTEFWEGLDEENSIKPVLKKNLGYEVFVNTDATSGDFNHDPTKQCEFRGKDIIYFMGHGIIDGKKLNENLFVSGTRFRGMDLQDSGSTKFHLTAEWIASDPEINPILMMAAGCITAMTSTNLADAKDTNEFLDDPAAFADSFKGSAYVGMAWELGPTVIYDLMVRFVKELKTNLTFSDSYDNYLQNNRNVKAVKLLKLYKSDDSTFEGNDVKPGN